MAHIAFMAVIGAVSWAALVAPHWVPGFEPDVHPVLSTGAVAAVVVIIVFARSMAFSPLPWTVISIDSGFYVAAALCFGSVTAGRVGAAALTVDAMIRLLTGPRRRSRRQWLDAGVYVAYFGGMSGALLAVVARLFRADDTAVFFSHDEWRVLLTVTLIGVGFVISHYAIQGVRMRLAGSRTSAFVTRMGLPAVLAELSLLPLASVIVFVYDPHHLLGLELLGGTYVLISFGFNRLSKIGSKLRQRVRELETLGAISTRLSGCLHIHELIEAVAESTTSVIDGADALSFCRVGSEGTLFIDSYRPDDRQFSRTRADAGDGLVSQVLHEDRTLALVPDDRARGTVLEHAGSWLGVPVRVFGNVEAVLVVEAADDNAFSSDARRLLEGIASQTSVALQNARHYELAMVDGLTGLFVRRYFDSRLVEEMERARRFDTSFAVAMVDIDDFKQLNDTHGHSVGDAALRSVARIVREEMRGIDTAARYGGEEFALVLPRTSLTEAYSQAERIRARVASLTVPTGHDGNEIAVTASFGIAAFPESGANDPEALLELADRALYRAKRTGKNRVELFWSEASSVA